MSTRTQLEQFRPWPATITGPSVPALRREVARAHKRGELAASGPMYPTVQGWAVDVYRLKPPRRRLPVWTVVTGSAVAVLAAAAATGWWLSSVVALVVPGSVLLTVALAVGRWVATPSGCTITHTRH